jgi:hypothetical protein
MTIVEKILEAQKHAPSKKDEASEAKFLKDLGKLRKKYPMVYLEAWTPLDFRTPWDSEQSLSVAETLYDAFDANLGTNWDLIEEAKK